MKKISIILLVLILFVVATPVAAKQILIGEQVHIYNRDGGAPTSEFQADTPFHIYQGWTADIDKWMHYYAFELEVDGIIVEPDFIVRSIEKEDTNFWLIMYAYNFPDGMPAGEHVFTGHWYGACQKLIDQGLYFGSCAYPTEIVEAMELVIPIQFIE